MMRGMTLMLLAGAMTYAGIGPGTGRSVAWGAGQAETPVLQLPASPPAAWMADDPADSLYRAAREALNRNDYGRAVELFRRIQNGYPRSTYTPDAYYWEAFALYRKGGTEDLKAALTALDTQARRYPKAGTRGDADPLATRIRGELARRGDAAAAADVAQEAKAATQATPSATGSCSDDDDDTRVAALNALLQMDADRAVPILRKVLARRDPCSEILRRKAVFLVSQKQTAETESILLAAAKNDPDDEVRQQAVFWLSQVDTEVAVSALDSILRTSKDEELQKKAIFALSQMENSRAKAIIRSYAAQGAGSDEVQAQAIFWLGQENTSENAGFLKDLYQRLKNPDLKEKVIFALSQMEGQDTGRWLLDLATDEREDMEMRKKALFWAGQNGESIAELIGLYGRLRSQEMKEQLIFVYSQRDEKPALDKLIEIAKTEPDKELRKKAIFWLSQSDDPRAAQLLQDILEQ